MTDTAQLKLKKIRIIYIVTYISLYGPFQANLRNLIFSLGVTIYIYIYTLYYASEFVAVYSNTKRT